MSLLLLMIPASIFIGFCFLVLFIWATKKGQFDDLVTPAHRILIEEDNNKEDKKNV